MITGIGDPRGGMRFASWVFVLKILFCKNLEMVRCFVVLYNHHYEKESVG